jgi:chemotaxis protein CheX
MDDKYIKPFISSVLTVLPQLGITDIQLGRVYERGRNIETPGIIVILGLIGDIRGNVIYGITEECASSIASIMLMGMELTSFDEMAQSAISEMTNMLTANAATEFASAGMNIDISTPTLMTGKFSTTVSSEKVATIEMIVNGQPFEINLAVDKNR